MKKVYKIVEWVTYDYILKKAEEYKSYGFCVPLDIDEELKKYIYEIEFDEYEEDTLIKELVENRYIICGDTHQNLAIPVYEHGYLLLSMRRWAEIMKKAFELQQLREETPYASALYHNFYMKCLSVDDEVLPKCTTID